MPAQPLLGANDVTTHHGSHTYVLRIWSEREHGRPPAFRAALTDVATKETHYFSDALALVRHLRELRPGGVRPG